MIQLKRFTDSNAPDSLEYGQLGLQYNTDGTINLYAGNSDGTSKVGLSSSGSGNLSDIYTEEGIVWNYTTSSSGISGGKFLFANDGNDFRIYPEGRVKIYSDSSTTWRQVEFYTDLGVSLGCEENQLHVHGGTNGIDMSSAGIISINTTDAYSIDITSGENITLDAIGYIRLSKSLGGNGDDYLLVGQGDDITTLSGTNLVLRSPGKSISVQATGLSLSSNVGEQAGTGTIDSSEGLSLVGGTTMNIQSSSNMSISTTGSSSNITITSAGTTALYNNDLFLKTSMIMMQSDAGTITINAPTKTLMVNANSLQCSSQPMDDNDVVTKKYIDNLSYSPQASINTGTMVIMGFVRQLNEVFFSIPLDWQLSGTSFYDCQFKSGNMEVMQGDANTDTSPTYIFGGRQGGQPVVGNVKVGNVYRGNNILTIRMVKEDGSNFTKAHTGPCCIMLRNVTIAGTSLS